MLSGMAFREPEAEMLGCLVGFVCLILIVAGWWPVAVGVAACATANVLCVEWDFDRSVGAARRRSKDAPRDGT